MRDQQINTFQSGMIKDIGATFPQDGSYIDAENIRIISDGTGDNQTGIAINVKGNSKRLTLQVASNVIEDEGGRGVYYQRNFITPIILGHTVIRNTIVLICKHPSIDRGYIFTVDYTQDILEATLIYNKLGMGLSEDYPIEAIGIYEREDTQRIYWTDNLNPVRTLNIKQDPDTMPEVDEISLNPTISFSSPEVVEINSTGALPAGMYQYAYRLKTNEGAVSRFSTLTPFVSILDGTEYWAYSEDPENVIEYGNTTPGVVTDKSVKIKISNMDIDYDILEVAAVYRSDIDSIANTYIIYSKPISSPQEQIVNHRNTVSMGAALLPQEITEITNLPSKVKTLNTKDNRLFLGGLSYSPFNLEFNSRAYRYRRIDEVENPISPSNSVETYVTNPDSDEITFEDRDAINPFNSYSQEKALPGDQYKFRKDGVTLGGEGPNVSYKFIKKRFRGNELNSIPDAAPFVKGSFVGGYGCDTNLNSGDYKSALNATEFVGYQRDEIYRFGIVLYDKKGNPGFVNWIADIRFPDYSDYDYEGAYNGGIYNFTIAQSSTSGSGTNYNISSSQISTADLDAYTNMDTFDPNNNLGFGAVESSYDNEDEDFNTSTSGFLYALGIKFNVTIPDGIKEQISGYRIVRVERREEDKTVLGSGILNYLSTYNIQNQIFHQHTGTAGTGGDPNYNALLNQYQTNDDAVQAANTQFSYGKTTNFLFTIDSPEWPFTQNYPSGGADCLYIKVNGAITGGSLVDFTQDDDGTNIGQATVLSAHKLSNRKEDLFSTYPLQYANKFSRAEEGLVLNIPNVTEYVNVDAFSAFSNSSQSQVDSTITSYTGFVNKSLTFSGASGGDVSANIKHAGIGEETFLGATSGEPIGENEELVDLNLSVPYNIVGIDWLKWINASVGQKNKGKLYTSVKKDLLGNQYIGNTYSDRKKNSYIPAGPFISIEEDPAVNDDEIYNLDTFGAHDVWGGDTYVVLYDLEKIRRHSNQNPVNDPGGTTGQAHRKKSSNFAFPAESTINTTIRGGWHFANKRDWNLGSETLLNTFDLEPVYRSINNTEIYIPKPLTYNPESNYDSRIAYSDTKILGSLVDGWRKFRISNYTDLEGLYGKINKLSIFNDNMYFLQNNAFGGLSINPVSTVLDESGSSIVLGTGDVIQNSTYISNTIGTIDRESVVSTPRGIYWIDSKTKKIYAFRANGLSSISDVHGLKSWAYDNITESSTLVTGNDIINDEILFSVDDKTLVFSEAINKFTSFYTFGTKMFINTYDKIFSIESNSLYEHNMDSYTWYENPFESNIEFIVNKNPLFSKAYDNLEWYAVGGGANQDLFEKAIFSNSFDSKSVNFVDEQSGLDYFPFKKVKEKLVKMPIPRTEGNFRFRDTYLKVKLITENTAKVALHYVKTIFRISRR